MQYLKNSELKNVNGGISVAWGFLAIGITFIASVIYGYIHPNKCEV